MCVFSACSTTSEAQQLMFSASSFSDPLLCIHLFFLFSLFFFFFSLSQLYISWQSFSAHVHEYMAMLWYHSNLPWSSLSMFLFQYPVLAEVCERVCGGRVGVLERRERERERIFQTGLYCIMFRFKSFFKCDQY